MKRKYLVRFRELRAASGVLWPIYGLWGYDLWLSHNDSFFDGELGPVGIVWGLTPHGHNLASYGGDGVITLHPSLLLPSTDNPWEIGAKVGRKFTSDVLLHEMVHQKLDQTGAECDGPSSHNNTAWADEIVRISTLLGISGIKAQRVRQRRIGGQVKWAPPDGFLSLRDMAHWPHCTRPAGYYGNDRGV